MDNRSVATNEQLDEQVETLHGASAKFTVERVRDVETGEVFIRKKTTNQELIPELQREARLYAAFNHPNIVHLIDFTNIGAEHYITLEYCNEGDLYDWLKTQYKFLDRQQTIIFLNELTSGLSYMHSLGYAHSDLRAKNVFIHDGHLKIGDLGSAELLGKAFRAIPPAYAPPEFVQSVGGKTPMSELTTEAEVFGMATIMYELVTGGANPYPYHQRMQTNFDDGIPHGEFVSIFHNEEEDVYKEVVEKYGVSTVVRLDNVFRKCFSFDPKKRPKSVEETQQLFLDALDIKLQRQENWSGLGRP